MRRPRAVVVTGAPGSGKSTLARGLSSLMRVPYLARDDVRGGLLFTAGAWTEHLSRVPTAGEAVDAFLDLAEQTLHNGVSCILEYVIRAHRPADLERIRAAGDCVVVITSCPDPMARVRDRNGADRLIANPAVLAAAGHATVDEHTDALVDRMTQVTLSMQTDFPVPTLRVNTTDGYLPPIDEVLAFVTSDRH